MTEQRKPLENKLMTIMKDNRGVLDDEIRYWRYGDSIMVQLGPIIGPQLKKERKKFIDKNKNKYTIEQ